VGHETNIGCPRPKKQKNHVIESRASGYPVWPSLPARPKKQKTMLLNQPAASPHKQAVPLAPKTKKYVINLPHTIIYKKTAEDCLASFTMTISYATHRSQKQKIMS
jgi:hypothetical protein